MMKIKFPFAIIVLIAINIRKFQYVRQDVINPWNQ